MITTPNKNKILELYTGKIKSISGSGECWLGFSSTEPNADGTNFTEPSSATYPSYERVRLNINAAMQYVDMFGSVADGVVTNVKEIVTKECKESGGYPSFSHFGIFGAQTGGIPIATDVLRDLDATPDENGEYPAKTLKINKNQVGVFNVGSLTLQLI